MTDFDITKLRVGDKIRFTYVGTYVGNGGTSRVENPIPAYSPYFKGAESVEVLCPAWDVRGTVIRFGDLVFGTYTRGDAGWYRTTYDNYAEASHNSYDSLEDLIKHFSGLEPVVLYDASK